MVQCRDKTTEEAIVAVYVVAMVERMVVVNATTVAG